MEDTPLAKAFPIIRTRIFKLVATWQDPKQKLTCHRIGTAFAIADLVRTRRFVLATAAHMFRDLPGDVDVTWHVFEVDEHSLSPRSVRLTTSPCMGDDAPFRFHTKSDVGLLIIPSHTTDDREFMRPDERPLAPIDPKLVVTEGTRVAWAGFSDAVAEAGDDEPALCYFEGVVSACVNRPGRSFYCVDGHCHQGTSGGPVWACLDNDSFNVIGVVSRYAHTSDGYPGFCVFEPINILIKYIESWPRASDSR